MACFLGSSHFSSHIMLGILKSTQVQTLNLIDIDHVYHKAKCQKGKEILKGGLISHISLINYQLDQQSADTSKP